MLYEIDLNNFWLDPYPDLKQIQVIAPVVFVPQLNAALITRRVDVFEQEKRIEIFSSRQPDGLMTRLMGENMMRKDGECHRKERLEIFPSLSPRTVKNVWFQKFEASTLNIIDNLRGRKNIDLVVDFAMPVSGAALIAMTGLREMKPAEMDQVSQAMINGCANYIGDATIEQTCNVATADIDYHIDRILNNAIEIADQSVLSVLYHAGQSLESIRANIKLVISGGQNEPRDAIAGTVAAVLQNPKARVYVERTSDWGKAFLEYARWMSPIGMSPRQVTEDQSILGYNFKKDDRVFFMFGAANRDPRVFVNPDEYDLTREIGQSIHFGAGPHFCAGAAASSVLITKVALPLLFKAFPNMELRNPVAWGGWAFRGPLAVNLSLG